MKSGQDFNYTIFDYKNFLEISSSGVSPRKFNITNMRVSAHLMGMGKYHKGGSRGVLIYEKNVRNFIS